MKNVVKENYQRILQEIGDKDVTVLAVVKGRDSADFDALRDVGLMTVGENRAQEFLRHYEEQISNKFKWHFIGQLQSNKVKYVVGKCELIHSLDRLSLAREIDRVAGARGLVQDCLIEVNMGDEESKGGLSPCINTIEQFIRDVSAFNHIRLTGFMAVMPDLDCEQELEKHYEKLSQMFSDLKMKFSNHKAIKLDILSAGMSNDYKLAVKYGATMIRLGRVLFE